MHITDMAGLQAPLWTPPQGGALGAHCMQHSTCAEALRRGWRGAVRV